MRYIIVLMLFSGSAMADWSGIIELSHISNPTVTENGYGLNAAFIDLKYTTGNAYIAAGIGIHSESVDCPEVCFSSNELARIRIGYEFDF